MSGPAPVETAFARVLDALHTRGCVVRGGGSQRNARCPAYDDTNPSLSITAEDSRVLVHCHAGCDTADVLAALNLTKADLFDEVRQRNGVAPLVVAEYAYVDEQGRLLYVVERRTPKAFLQRRPDGLGKWEWRLGDTRRVLYRLPAVLAAVAAGRTVYVVEGEKDVHAVEAAGQVATCNPGGAGKWRGEYSEYLRGADIVIVADRDDPGHSHAQAVHTDLAGKAASVRIVEPATGKDTSDHLAAGHGLDDLVTVEADTATSPGGEPSHQLDGEANDEPSSSVTAGVADLYSPIDWHELWARTSSEPDWLVPGIIECGRLHAIYAPKKHKKSLLTLVVVASLVTGRPLLGRPNPHGRSVRVLYIDIENSRDDIRQRLQDAGYSPGDLSDLTYYSFPSLPGLDSAAGGMHLLALVGRHQPELVVLDTTSRVVTGKENDADTFRSLYRHSLAPIKALGIAVLRLDNAGKDPSLGQRGSSAKGDDLDTAWVVSMHGEDRIMLRLDFQRSNHIRRRSSWCATSIRCGSSASTAPRTAPKSRLCWPIWSPSGCHRMPVARPRERR